MNSKNLQTLKVTFLGDKNVGKETFISNYVNSKSLDQLKKNKDKGSFEFIYQIPDEKNTFKIKIKIKLFSEKNDKLIDNINKSDCVIIIFEMSSRKSFENLLNYWLIFLRDVCHYKGEIIIFGNHVNKSEELKVDKDEINELLDVCGLDCNFTDIGQKEIEENNLLVDGFIKTACYKLRHSCNKKDFKNF